MPTSLLSIKEFHFYLFYILGYKMTLGHRLLVNLLKSLPSSRVIKFYLGTWIFRINTMIPRLLCLQVQLCDWFLDNGSGSRSDVCSTEVVVPEIGIWWWATRNVIKGLWIPRYLWGQRIPAGNVCRLLPCYIRKKLASILLKPMLIWAPITHTSKTVSEIKTTS